ncbi:hypothetical protein OH76DRAFT_803864 [Lentinus brumalis]|uniref:Uncharacterized protein n=1 Tax=Lentinus brumalis TaxID=2498619 RepID=A0A371D3A1_9APHY|nr:hypothetical protein OH76DRAFT_803864 [Polyporus brumalis]
MLIRSWPLRPRMPVISMASSPCPLQRLRASLGDAAVPPVAYMSLYYIDEADNHERENTFSPSFRRLNSELRVLEGGRGDESEVKIACFTTISSRSKIRSSLTASR